MKKKKKKIQFTPWEELIAFPADERAVFHCIANCEVSSYSISYPPKRVVVSTGEIAKMCLWSKYRTRKAIKGLVEKGLIERASCGNPAVVSYGEYTELVCESAPPTNGYAITKQGFQSEEWKSIYDMWCRSMEEWANMPLTESAEGEG